MFLEWDQTEFLLPMTTMDINTLITQLREKIKWFHGQWLLREISDCVTCEQGCPNGLNRDFPSTHLQGRDRETEDLWATALTFLSDHPEHYKLSENNCTPQGPFPYHLHIKLTFNELHKFYIYLPRTALDIDTHTHPSKAHICIQKTNIYHMISNS